MARHRGDLNPEELARQRALARSWEAAQRSLADKEFEAYVEASIQRVSVSEAKTISEEKFLAETEPSTE